MVDYHDQIVSPSRLIEDLTGSDSIVNCDYQGVLDSCNMTLGDSIAVRQTLRDDSGVLDVQELKEP